MIPRTRACRMCHKRKPLDQFETPRMRMCLECSPIRVFKPVDQPPSHTWEDHKAYMRERYQRAKAVEAYITSLDPANPYDTHMGFKAKPRRS